MSEKKEQMQTRLQGEKEELERSKVKEDLDNGFDAFASKLKRRLERKEFDPSRMNSQPTLEQMTKISIDSPAFDIASSRELDWIGDLWIERVGLPESKIFDTAFEIAWICYHNGSSANMSFKGRSKVGKDFTELIGAIREVCSLRQFCRAYANLVWTRAVVERTPPMHWQKFGFKDEVKYAAFDFFDAVGSDAAIQPKTGLPRMPTKQEQNANASRKKISVTDAQKRDGNNTIHALEVTGGRSGVKPEINSLRLNS
ncbi:coat protein [Musa ornata-associated banmivirus]|uniref:coat protein n=1 Tax=Musa ornata-associated banmivirus TaxID=3071210 RepID=UPI002481ABBA|nr:coat protein [Musa ornata-associated banmivirus]UIK24040.1 coat protein [Musa ornata-associated banmivirus]